MRIAILILLIFNTGLMIVLAAAVLSAVRTEIAKMLNTALHHVDETYGELGELIYNMDAVKQKAIMSGKAEI